ncbi:hypothetical protein EDI_096310 [Entamoeba dispar SAW760]|uniref:Uncharacterized protein n=1 Tax=Entamoeba dispar (strain ATCC PRA-260 / SAW760) TaxID=370354 RepID=B0EPR7_ENTDS|nr:uncharacterized protein EDI_096310 [Entamoeba dispar SAW760]EDR23497.1 hypothetical protein EDI_096310 [Entamoeba dispar SAW760]|eukprot:EDR23497.1 hypothetical protein EDI_096310 [Entamoeba dispar SAW760]
MFKDTNRLLSDETYETIAASSNRAFQLIKRNKKIMIHFIVHHIIQILSLISGLIIACIALSVTEHENGKKMVKAELVFASIAIGLYFIYMVFGIIAFRTHPIFTLITEHKRPLLFTKLANLVHRIYLIILMCNVVISIILSMTFNPTNELGHKIHGLWVMVFVDVIYLQLSCSELQKPFTFVARKVEQVEMGEKTEDQMEDEKYKEDVGVFTFGYNILGFQTYIKYIFDPNLGYLSTEAYFVGWVKEF